MSEEKSKDPSDYPYMDLFTPLSLSGNEAFLGDKYVIVANKKAFDWLYKMIETRHWYIEPLRMPKDHKDSVRNLYLNARHIANKRDNPFDDVEIT